MEMNLRMVFLVLGALIVLAILFDAFKDRLKKPARRAAKPTSDTVEPVIQARDLNALDSTMSAQAAPRSTPAHTGSIVMISLHAPDQHSFEGGALLSALADSGLRFGDRGIFQYERLTERGTELSFQLAKLTKPGTFDISDHDQCTSQGLLLFMEVSAVQDAVAALHKMLAAAHQLQNSLGGQLFEGYNSPWQSDSAENLMHLVQADQLRKSHAKQSTAVSTAES